MKRAILFGVSLIVGITFAMSPAQAAERRTSQRDSAVLGSDFNGDGYQDLAVGVPGRTVNVQGVPQHGAGAVQIWSGSATGLVRGKLWTKQSKGVLGQAIAGEGWGTQTSVGDIDGDGYSDLVITGTGGPGWRVSILYGSPQGLTSRGDQLFTVAGLVLGIATGDFDGDGHADLAIGSSEPSGVRSVHVWYGSGSGLDLGSEQEWDQNTPGIPDSNEDGDDFGTTLAAGDFNGDGATDLSVGALCESFGGLSCPGQVWTIYGSPTGLTSTGAQAWNQDTQGIKGIAENLEYFGWDQTTGDFNGGGYADLAVGAPGASREINVIYGSSAGLTASGNQLSTAGASWETLTSGDFNGDGRSDLAAGCFDCNQYMGFVRVWAGSGSGIDLANPTDWSQDSPGIGDVAEVNDAFGSALASGDYGLGQQDDLAVGVYDEGLNGLDEVGLAHAIFGSPQGLTSSGSQLLKEKPPVQFDAYGYSLNGGEDISH